MKTLAEYVKEAAKFKRMAEEATDQKLKIELQGKAQYYRTLALGQAQQLGLPPDEIPGMTEIT